MKPEMHPEEARPTLAQSPFHNHSGTRNLLRFCALAALVALSAIVVAGCGIFNPPTGGGGTVVPPPVYVIPSQPEFVLANLETAYSSRDSSGYKALYDSSYVGISEDLNDPPETQISTFRYADEVSHIGNLASNPNITSVSFRLGSPSSWDRLESNDPSHPEWAVIQISGSQFDVQVTVGVDNTLQVNGTNEFFEFSFTPTTPAPGSPSDTLWKIVKWRETRAAGP
jgi:hypothetical protein